MSGNTKTIGETIREQRQKKGFTQDYLASELHVSAQAISKWETGQTTPDITLLLPLSRALEISVNELLGGDRRKAFEEEWQDSVELGEEITLLVAEEALKEFPDDETFLYRRACDEYFLGTREGRQTGSSVWDLRCAEEHFEELNRRFPDNASYKEMLARTYFARGRKEDAFALAYACNDNYALATEFSEGDDKLRLKQNKIKNTVDDLYEKLLDYNTRESINAAYGLMNVMMGEGEAIRGKYLWRLCIKDALLYYDEGNYEAYAEKLTEAYEAAKAYDAIEYGDISYTAPLFDHLKIDEVDRWTRDNDKLLECFLSDKKFSHSAVADLKKRMADDTLWYGQLHRHQWKNYYNFCRKYICNDYYNNFSTSWHMTPEEEYNKYQSLMNLSHGHERLRKKFKDEVEKFIKSGVMGGYVARCGETIVAFCHCGPRESFKVFRYDEETGVPTLPEGSKVFSIVEIMIADNFKDCGIEEKLLSLAIKEAKELGFTHAEIHPLERMVSRAEREYFHMMLELYKKLGFEVVRDMSTEEDGVDCVMQKEL